MDDHINTDYETDFFAWTNTQAELLRAKRFDQLDLENLIEELEGMARNQRRELEHRIEQLVMHLLKCKMQPQHISGSWLGTITEQRYRIAKLLAEMPSLKPLLDQYIMLSYDHAATRAARETGISKSAFPPTMPFTKDQLFDPDYLL
jgi:hypothetical protein